MGAGLGQELLGLSVSIFSVIADRAFPKPWFRAPRCVAAVRPSPWPRPKGHRVDGCIALRQRDRGRPKPFFHQPGPGITGTPDRGEWRWTWSHPQRDLPHTGRAAIAFLDADDLFFRKLFWALCLRRLAKPAPAPIVHPAKTQLVLRRGPGSVFQKIEQDDPLSRIYTSFYFMNYLRQPLPCSARGT